MSKDLHLDLDFIFNIICIVFNLICIDFNSHWVGVLLKQSQNFKRSIQIKLWFGFRRNSYNHRNLRKEIFTISNLNFQII